MEKKRTYAQALVKRKSRSAYWISLFSMSLVLFFLGLFFTATFYGRNYAAEKEKTILLEVYLYDGISEERRLAFEEELRARPYTESLQYVSQEKAAEIFQQGFGVGKELDSLVGDIPLPASYEVKLKGEYVKLDSLVKIQQDLQTAFIVSDVDYPLSDLTLMRKNIRLLAWIFLFMGLILTAIAFYLIFGTIRLSIYAQRLSIRSMQLIGATRAFIRRPFLFRGLGQGGLAGILACLLLVITLMGVDFWVSKNTGGQDEAFPPGFIGLLVGIVLFGLALGFSGSYFAVNKYLSRDLDELL